MLTTNAILAGITTASFAYIGLSLAAVNIKSRAKRVGGIRFLRIGRHQFSYCRTRQPAVIKAERMAQATKRAQTQEQRRLDAIASRWCNG